MRVSGIDHVNIVAADLKRTVAFYGALLGLKRTAIPLMDRARTGCWLTDEAGQAVIHLQAHDPARHGPLRSAGDVAGGDTGAIDHVAFVCSDFDAMLRHCREAGLTYRVSEPAGVNFRQLFVTDPDNVLLELNFNGD